MRKNLTALIAVLFIMPAAQAQVPETIAYQGYITDADSNPMAGTVDITFRLYRLASGGAELWAESHTGVVVSDGVFTVELGSTEPFEVLLFDRPLYLGVTVGEGDELRPRVALTATPYSLATRGLDLTFSEDGSISNVVLGYAGNGVDEDAEFGTIGGGIENRVTDNGGTVGGGYGNTAGGFQATIAGGLDNRTAGLRPTIGGGESNAASADWSVVPGGWRNEARGIFSFAAGSEARAAHDGTFVWNAFSGQGDSLVSTSDNQFLIRASGGVGIGTNAPSSPLTVAGIIESTEGGFKFPDGSFQETAAPSSNGHAAWHLAGNEGTTPGSHFLGTTDDAPLELRVNGQRALLIEASGDEDDAPNLVAGHTGNRFDLINGEVRPQGVTIGGGGGGVEGDDDEANIAAANYATIGGGRGNRAEGTSATVGGGQFNEALTGYDTVAGGRSNRAEGGGDLNGAAVGGGLENSAIGEAATVGGGIRNIASGTFSTVPGGSENVADGYASLAAGLRAQANHDGTFVWADRSDAEFVSTDENQFLIRAAGGVGIGSNAPKGALHVTHPTDGTDLILGGAGESALFGDDGMISSDPDLPSSDLLLLSNDAVGIVLDVDGSGEETAEFVVVDGGFDEAFRVDVTGSATTGSIELENELGEGTTLETGGVYRDNIVYAWAHVNADGSTAATFGCTVTKLAADGRYSISFDRALTDGAAPLITPINSNPVLATILPDDGNAEVTVFTFRLDPNTGQFQREDNAFYFQVVGRP